MGCIDNLLIDKTILDDTTKNIRRTFLASGSMSRKLLIAFHMSGQLQPLKTMALT